MNVKGLSPEEAAAKVVGTVDGGRRPDACVDCCGFESSVATALAAAKSGGKVCLVGMVRATNTRRRCVSVRLVLGLLLVGEASYALDRASGHCSLRYAADRINRVVL